ncbi:MAG: transposase [Bryobacterales bacterium]|nr:transposase [Bryobacterales bacterium]
MDKVPSTLQEAILYFADADNCREFMIQLRWPDGKVTCPYCGSEGVAYLPNARVFKCFEKHERQKFSLKVGTIFEDSPIGLEKWLPVMWMVVNSKNGISSYEVHRAIWVTQKTAWFMLQRIRLALQEDGGGGLGGEVEAGETFIGGKRRSRDAGPKVKPSFAAVLERGGRVRAKAEANGASNSFRLRRSFGAPHLRRTHWQVEGRRNEHQLNGRAGPGGSGVFRISVSCHVD